MTPEPHPAVGTPEMSGTKHASRNLLLRVISSAVLAPLAIGMAYLGGWPFALFWTIAAIIVWQEWTKIVHPTGHPVALVTGICALIIQAFLLMYDREVVAIMIAGLGALAAVVMAPRNSVWIAAGLLYASAVMIAPIMIRGDNPVGFFAILFVFAVVWATDIVAYFTGRAIGGPKLAPSISPKKTWSGAIGGTVGAIVAGIAVALPSDIRSSALIGSIAIALSVMSQAGDLFESRMKRIFNVKDSGTLIPGHGGAMDRLDGFVAAALAALVIGAVRAGWNSPAAGLIGW